MTGLTVAIQGVGHVGAYLAEKLHKAGAKLIITDVNQANLEAVAAKTGAEIVAPDAIYDVAADIYAPCALGATLNPQTLDRLKVKAVCGAANNQLATADIGDELFKRGVLYAPDYVINGGGIINVASAAAFGAAPGMAAYNVSKAGTLSLSETLAAELAGTGINVTVLCPTFVKTNIVNAGRIPEETTQLADRLMRITGFSPERVARTCLDTLDRGGLYCMPNPEARIGWGIKRFTPTVYTRAAGLATRVTT